ncbi:MAG: short-chain fatty acid transporter [Bacteroidetes bacterium GWF2_38_335]|nr:MAG: short-chain fatty acid transporter [Bacteroidetes bacterium GWF2_38_335]OFY80736.1 MAG: short-chain fatty acid transporter [Bacteroidetes bacterium RIFOXYA12_FULL_38_20]HBS87038.1 short-chain fatty acid transporter [Bacteroidales bacterium]
MKKVPHTYVIVFMIMIIIAVLTWIVPAGEYDRIDKTLEDGSVKSVVADGSYHEVDSIPQTWQVFSAFFTGFTNQSHIIIFILLIGGAFWIMNSTKSLDVGIMVFLRMIRRLEKYRFMQKVGVNNIVMVLIMLMFSAFGAIFGMSEETIAFIVIMVPLAISMGYDSIVGVCLVYVAAHIGFAGAIFNPFTIGIAQGIAEVPMFSGFEYRFICWLILNTAGFAFILFYAAKIKKNPKKSVMYEADEYWRSQHSVNEEKIKYYTPVSAWVTHILTVIALALFAYEYPETTLTVGNKSIVFPAVPICAGLFALTGFLTLLKSVHFYIINLLMFTVVFLIVGAMGYGWYVVEIGTLFFVMGLISGFAVGMNANEVTKSFLDGVRDILSAALIVGLAGGIIVLLQDGKIMDTFMYSVSDSMKGIGETGSVSAMYGITTGMNILIPSGSAKAALMMPIMAPFADLAGISKQAVVLAFQFGDGITNMITPASGVLIGALGIAKIPYDKWFKWVWPLILMLTVIGLLLLIATVNFEITSF